VLVISAAATAMDLYSDMTFGKTGNDNDIWSHQKMCSRPELQRRRGYSPQGKMRKESIQSDGMSTLFCIWPVPTS
jgi:hypothetical protein